MCLHRICKQSNMTGATSIAETSHPSGAPEVTPGFQWCFCYSIFSFLCKILQIVVCPFVLFVLLLCCMSFFDLRILIVTFVSYNQKLYNELCHIVLCFPIFFGHFIYSCLLQHVCAVCIHSFIHSFVRSFVRSFISKLFLLTFVMLFRYNIYHNQVNDDQENVVGHVSMSVMTLSVD